MELNQIFANKKWLYVLIGLVILVFVVVGFLTVKKGPSTTGPASGKVTSQGYVANTPNALPTVQGGTREKITTKVATPDVNAVNLPKNVAVPQNVVKTGGNSFRQFKISAQGNQFVPNTIVVNAGDVLDLTLEAVDSYYKIVFPDFGVGLTAGKGATAHAQFQVVNYGQYQFSCSSCSGDVHGTLIVNQ